jgi:hypothetical protein
MSDSRSLELLKFINQNDNKKVDYSCLFNSSEELFKYCGELQERGFIKTYSAVFLGDQSTYITEIKPRSLRKKTELWMCASMTVKGKDYLDEIAQKPHERVLDELRDKYPSLIVKGLYLLTGIIITVVFNYIYSWISLRK